MAPSASVAAALARVEAAPGDKGPAYEALLADVARLSTPDTAADDLKAIADSFLAQGLGVVATRAVLTALVAALAAGPDGLAGPPALPIAVGSHVLAALGAQPTAASSFPDATAALCELVAAAHEADEDWAAAARALAAIPLDGSQRRLTGEDRARVWVRIARNLLEVDDAPAAEAYVNKLKNIMHTVADADLTLHFRLAQARIHDAKRDFLAAAQRYHDISMSSAVAEDERLHTLAMAIKCAILAPAGPTRSRALARLYKDERCAQLAEFAMLEKMFLDRLLSPAEVDKFAEGLQPHQLAATADGSTVLARAVVEHNLLGASRLYANIGFDALGALLGLAPARAEETTARMIEQGRLVGRIDQIDGTVYFERGEASGEKGSGRAAAVVGKQMRRWDANVEGISHDVENITNALQKEFPVRRAARPALLSGG